MFSFINSLNTIQFKITFTWNQQPAVYSFSSQCKVDDSGLVCVNDGDKSLFGDRKQVCCDVLIVACLLSLHQKVRERAHCRPLSCHQGLVCLSQCHQHTLRQLVTQLYRHSVYCTYIEDRKIKAKITTNSFQIATVFTR
jgi:hypothetical protein